MNNLDLPHTENNEVVIDVIKTNDDECWVKLSPEKILQDERCEPMDTGNRLREPNADRMAIELKELDEEEQQIRDSERESKRIKWKIAA